MLVVIDTNVLIAAISPKSLYHVIFKALFAGKFRLLISTEIYFEYTELLTLKSKHENLFLFEKFILESENVLVSEPTTRWNIIVADKDDNKFVDCAIAGKAEYLVTNDAHFNVLKNIEPPFVKLISGEDFIKLITHE